VQAVYESLPEPILDKMENVAIVVEDEPSEIVSRKRGVRQGSMLLGLYEGVPLTHRGTSYGMYPVVPDRITLFRIPLQMISRTEEHLRTNIRDTLIHEIAHHYGMSEDEIQNAGY
jgi:predicted Zn-dependent protease with MMP-like domain